MKKLYLKSVLFTTLFVSIYTVYYISVDYVLNKKGHSTDAYYIWGDSQVCQAFNFSKLSMLTGKQVYSAAYHAGAAYDLLVFSNKIPKNSEVIVGISYGMILRDRGTDYNRSGLSLKALYHLAKHGYSFPELVNTFYLNMGINRLYPNFSAHYENNENPILNRVEEFSRKFQSHPEYLENEKKLFYIGISQLIKKGCKVTILDLPFHDEIQPVIAKSSAIKEIRNFEYSLVNEFGMETDTLVLHIPANSNVMYDITHMNALGRELFTENFASEINRDLLSRNNLIIYHIQEEQK